MINKGRALTAWDKELLKNFPYYIDLSQQNYRRHAEILEDIASIFKRDNFTWKGTRFFFKDRDDATLFALKWG